MSTARKFQLFVALLGSLAPYATSAAVNEALDNILVSKVNGVATLQIWPACQIRYVDHTPAEAGTEVRIRVSTGPDCADLLGEVKTEVYLPAGRRMGNVDDVVFDAMGGQNTYITVRFAEPQKYNVRQHPSGWIEVFVDTNIDSASLPANAPPPLAAATAAAAAASAPPEFRSTGRAPRENPQRSERTTRLQVEPSSTGGFVVQLGVFASVDEAVAELLRTETPHFAYTTDFSVNGRTWQGLQVGFFDSEATAENVLADLRTTFPDSWVRHVDPDEASLARSQGELRSLQANRVPAVRISREAADDQGELAAMMASGRQALLERRYADAVDSYTRVLETPQHSYRAQAREYLGVAHERSGKHAHSIAEYEAYLIEFPDDEGAARVQDRLNALRTAGTPVSSEAIAAQQTAAGDWQFYGGFSQYYWRNEEQLVHDGNHVVSGSGVLALGDMTAAYRGSRFDLLARVNGAYQFNLVEADDTGDVGWLSDAYLSIVDHSLGLQGRFGRQSQRSDGVLTRFDGAALSYQWKPDISFSASTGFPIDSPRYVSGSHRFFYAAGAHVDNLWDKFDISGYTHLQTVDGINDRQAVGGELQFRDGPLSVVSLIDFDVSYEVLNTALVNGNWTLQNGWRLYGMVDFGAQPYMTTRNALAGQTATSVDELLDTYTEGQVRTLARDRTAQATTASVGFGMPFWDRFDFSFDVTGRQSDGTISSGGAAAIPATGSQMFYNATVVASNLMRQGDLTILTLRHDTTRTRDMSMLLIDTRLPFGEGLRINPRVVLRQQTINADGSDQIIVSPALRLIYRWRKLLIDLEAGGHWSNRDLGPGVFDPFVTDGTEELTGLHLNLGYRLEF